MNLKCGISFGPSPFGKICKILWTFDLFFGLLVGQSNEIFKNFKDRIHECHMSRSQLCGSNTCFINDFPNVNIHEVGISAIKDSFLYQSYLNIDIHGELACNIYQKIRCILSVFTCGKSFSLPMNIIVDILDFCTLNT